MLLCVISFRSFDRDSFQSSVTQEHTGGHEFPYQHITSSQLGRFQNAIENATTQSDFEKLETIIKHGQVIQQRDNRLQRIDADMMGPPPVPNETTMMLHSARDGVKGVPAEHHLEAGTL